MINKHKFNIVTLLLSLLYLTVFIEDVVMAVIVLLGITSTLLVILVAVTSVLNIVYDEFRAPQHYVKVVLRFLRRSFIEE